MRWNQEFQDWLDRHANVFRRADALACGVSARRFRTGIARGDWSQFRSVWIVANAPRSRAAMSWAALLKGGGSSRLTGITALSLYGLDVLPFQLHIAVPTTRRRPIPESTMLRDKCRTGLDTHVRGFPAATRDRAIVDALRILDEADGRGLLFEVLRKRWISETELAKWSRQLRGHRGNSRLRRHVATAASGTRAESEQVLMRIMSGAGLKGWNFNEDILAPDGELIGIGDCVNRSARVVVEVDGMAWHTSADRFQGDRTRQNKLVNAGWRVLRFTWWDLTHRPDGVLNEIRQAVDE